jgi:hypothetical protein
MEINNMGIIEPQRPSTEPFKRGKFVFDGIEEGDEQERRILKFAPRLIVEYNIWQKNDPKTGQECYPDNIPIIGFGTYDFGLTMSTALHPDFNHLCNGYGGLTRDSEPEDILLYTIIFDLFHAFCQNQDDPNYIHYHWALKGWLIDRAMLIEDTFFNGNELPPDIEEPPIA